MSETPNGLSDDQSLYFFLGQIRADIQHIRQTQDTNADQVSSLSKAVRAEVKEIEQRVTKLEHARIKVIGWVAGISTAAGIGSWKISQVLGL